ncbi:MAG: NUDIX hydrolase [Thermodesulfobacteriota bacterium]
MIKIGSVDKKTDYRHLNLYAVNYRDRLGNDRTWYIASRNDPPKCVSNSFGVPDAVVIVAHHREQGGLVVIKEFRVPLGGYQYGFPAGLVDPGETIEQACTRELWEETGLSVARFVKTSPPIYSSSGMSDESVVMVYAECTGELSSAGNAASEVIYPFLVTPEEADRLCRHPDCTMDVKTWLVLESYARAGRVV